VSSDLTVYGVNGLSIIDGSIVPLVPATHLQATMYAVAEKAADIIKSRSSSIFSVLRFLFL
jgi:choline dehydrogenase-like flavoprotein